jgi:hypothetical protein
MAIIPLLKKTLGLLEAMFKGINNRWNEARTGLVRRSVDNILERYSGYGWSERYELLSAFDHTKNDLEGDNGAIAEWPRISQDAMVKLLKQGAKSAPHDASGMYLLSLYIDLHTIPGEAANRLKSEIEEWHQVAIQTDIDAPSTKLS